MARRDVVDQFDLFLDESGTFMETSTSPRERHEAGRSRSFPSQLAGLLVPRRALTRDTGQDALTRIFRRAGMQFEDTLHGMELRAGSAFDSLVVSLVQELDERGWRPVRLTNRERVSYGDRVANYTNLVAELAIRLFQQHQRDTDSKIALNFTCAVVKLGDTADDLPILLEHEEYLARLRETHARSAVRRGLAAESSGWSIASFRTGSARSWPELMLCDLVSNASHDGFRKLGPEAKDALARAMDPLDFTLRIQELMERVDSHLDNQSFGAALALLAERATEPDRGGPAADGIRRRLDRIVNELGDIGAPMRDPQLALVVTHLEQTISQRRALDEGMRLARWLARELVPPLRRRLASRGTEHTVEWFEYALAHLQLSACNFGGDPGRGHEHLTTMHERLPSVTGRFEHTQLALSGMLAEATHTLASFDPDRSLALALSVSRFFDDLGRLFADAMAGAFPEHVRADLRGHALRVAMGASAYRALLDGSGDFSEARGYAEAAIDEFDSPGEWRNIHRIRCEVEIHAGDLDAATQFLAQGVEAAEVAHEAIATGIAEMPAKSVARGAAILNWLRLGLALIENGDKERAQLFHNAWRRGKFENDDWCRIGRGPYPRHGILRRLAELQAIEKRRDQAIATFSLLQEAVGARGEAAQILGILAAAGAMRLAARLHAAHPGNARKLLDNNDRARPGAIQRLESVASRDVSEQARTWSEQWLDACRQAVDAKSGTDVRRLLLDSTASFPF